MNITEEALLVDAVLDICTQAKARAGDRSGVRYDQIYAINRTRRERGDRAADALAALMATYLPPDYYLYDAQEWCELRELTELSDACH